MPSPNPPKFLFFSGGTALNAIESIFRNFTDSVYVLPISDNGGSSSVIMDVIGGPSIGDIRSRICRLADDSTPEARAVGNLLMYRLPFDSGAAKAEWHDIVEGTHDLWKHISEPYKETIRAFLIHFNAEVLRQANKKQFTYSNGSVGNFFLTGARIFFNSLETSLFWFSRVVRIPSNSSVLPIINTNGTIHIGVELENGVIIHGQHEISHPTAVPSHPSPRFVHNLLIPSPRLHTPDGTSSPHAIHPHVPTHPHPHHPHHHLSHFMRHLIPHHPQSPLQHTGTTSPHASTTPQSSLIPPPHTPQTPSTISQTPATVCHDPSTNSQIPPTISQTPSTTSHDPSAISQTPSQTSLTNSHNPPAIPETPSINSQTLSTISQTSPTNSHASSTISHTSPTNSHASSPISQTSPTNSHASPTTPQDSTSPQPIFPTARRNSYRNLVVNKNENAPLDSKIKRLFYLNEDRQEILPPCNPSVLAKIREQDTIVYSIGSLWTSIMPCLVLKGIGEEISAKKGHKILVLNGYPDRETHNVTATDYVIAITNALNRWGTLARTPRDYITHVLWVEGSKVPVDEAALRAQGIECTRVARARESQVDAPLYEESELVERLSELGMYNTGTS